MESSTRCCSFIAFSSSTGAGSGVGMSASVTRRTLPIGRMRLSGVRSAWRLPPEATAIDDHDTPIRRSTMTTQSYDSAGNSAGGGATKVGPIAGIVAVVLFLLGFMLVSTPAGDDPDAKWISYWQDSGHRTSAIIASIATCLAAVGF